MPIIAMGPGAPEDTTTPPPETPQVPADGIIAQTPDTPSYGRVLADVPEKVGLSFIEAGAGGARALGDLLGMNNFADAAAEMARNAKGAADTLTPGEMTLGQKILSGGAESAGQMLPALATGGASLVATGIGLAAAQQAGSRYSELRDAGFSGGRSGFVAALDGLFEGLGEYVGLPVLAKAGRPFLNKLVHFAARDLVGEEFTTVMEQANAMLNDKPDMTWQEFLQGMAMTAAVTPVAAGFQTGAAHVAERVRAVAAPREAAAPNFQAPKQEKPAPTPEAGPQPPVTEKATTPPVETVVTAPPEKPAVTSEAPAPDSIFSPDLWKAEKNARGESSYVAIASGVRIAEGIDPGVFEVVNPVGEIMHEAKSWQDAHAYADNAGLLRDQQDFPAGWVRATTDTEPVHYGGIYYPVSDTSNDSFRVGGMPGNWHLRPPPTSPGSQSDIAFSSAKSVFDAINDFNSHITKWQLKNGEQAKQDELARAAGFDKRPTGEWVHGETGWFIRQRRDGQYEAITPTGVRSYTTPDFADALDHAKRKIAAGPAAAGIVGDLVKVAKKLTNVDFADALHATPEEMQQRGKYDPRVFNGLSYQDGSGHRVHVDVHRNTDGTFDITLLSAMIPGLDMPVHEIRNQTVQESLDFLHKRTGLDITSDLGALTTLHSDHVLGRLQTNPTDVLPQIGTGVEQYFGRDSLRKIAAGAAAQKENLGFFPNAQNEGRQSIGNRVSTARMGYAVVDASGKVYDLNQVSAEQAENMLPPGTYIQQGLQDNPMARKLVGMLERLRKQFLPDTRILFRKPYKPTTAGSGAGGMIGKNLATVMLGNLEGHKIWTPRQIQQSFYAVAHEFGHLVVMKHFYEASGRVRAELMASYYDYTSGIKRDTTLLEYLLQHHVHPRGEANPEATKGATGGLITIGEVATQNPPWIRYAMSFTEYLADQAAHFFIYRSGINSTNPEVRTFYQDLLASLKALWDKLTVNFKVNVPYHKWLESLGGPPSNIGSTYDPVTNPPTPRGEITKLPKVLGTDVTSKSQAEALAEKAGKLMDELYRAGATKEEIDSLSPTGLIADIDWNRARELADAYGIPRSSWGERYGRGQVDDTTGFRENLNHMAQRMADREDASAIGATNQAIKSFNWLLQKTMTAVQLRKRFGDIVPGVKAFVDNLEKMFSYRSRWKERADNRITDMRGLGHAERNRVFDLLLNEDKSGQFASKLDRDITGKRIFNLIEEAIKQYKLSEKGVALYRSIREDFDAAIEELELQADAELRRLYSPGPALDKALAELHDGFAQMKARPYVPHTRFGDHTVTVRTPEGVMREFYQFESEREAKAHEARLRAEYGNTARVSRGKMTDIQRIMAGLPPQLINAMKAQLGLSTEQIGKFEDILKDMSQGASFVRHFKRRKDVKGWADDAEQFPRAYADYMSRFANHVSRLKYNHELSSSISGVKSQAVDASKLGVNTVQLNDLASWLSRLQDYINQPGVEYANMRAAATIWYLGLNTKSALVNSASVPMVTLPYLSKRFGYAKATAAVTQAYKDIAKQYTRLDALAPDERKMMQFHREGGKIDASFASELAGLREGGRLSDQTALSKPAAAFFGMKYWAMWLFQKMEVINREVTALATYRLNRTKRNFAEDDPHGFDQQAAEIAGRAIQDTQNENAQWNRSEYARGRKSLLTMFMGYQQNIIYQMLGGDESWMRLLAAQMVVAGMMGIPFAQDLDELIKAFARKVFGSDINVEKAVRALLKDTMVNADWFLHGISHNMGGIDLSGSLSQGRVIPGVDALAMEGNFADRLANAAGDVGGAGFSIMLNALKTAASNDPSSWKKWSRTMPEFARSFVEGGEMLSGSAKDGKGNKVADTSTGDAFMRSLGFQVSNVTSERDKRFAQRDTAQYWLTRRAYVLALWERALQDRDSAGRDKARQALRDFNTEAPDRALRITSEQLRDSLKRRATSEVRTERGLGPSNTLTETYRRVGDLYQ